MVGSGGSASPSYMYTQRWGHNHGLSFAPMKTKIVNFTTKRNLQPFHLVLNGELFVQDTHTKFLGLTFDRTLTWQLHIQIYTKNAPIN